TFSLCELCGLCVECGGIHGRSPPGPPILLLSCVMREQFIKSFASAALSADPDLAIAALMIARVEYPKLDAGPYLDQLAALGHEARVRVTAAPVVPGEAPPRVDPDRYARVMALNEYLFNELHFIGNE